jgi:tripartite-type tricarboxylate transporter receptor subunit TctC
MKRISRLIFALFALLIAASPAAQSNYPEKPIRLIAGFPAGSSSAVNAQIIINASLYKLPYDPVKDFAPISQLYLPPNILVVYNGLPAKSVQELLTLARARPGELTFASGGSGSSPHLAGELFKSTARVDIRHIPYKGVRR